MPFDDEDNFQAYQTEIYLPFTSISYFFPLLHLLIMKSICAIVKDFSLFQLPTLLYLIFLLV